MKKTYDITYSTKVERKHPLWAKPYVNGKVKVFFVPSVRHGREVVEFIQRNDIEYETVTIDRAWDMNKWGLGDFYDKRGAIWDQDLMYQNMENVLTSDEHFDVLVLPGINGWGYFTPKTRQAILKRVENGAGLVLIHPYSGKDMEKVEELDKLSPLEALYEEGLNDGGYPVIEFDKLGKDRWIFKKHYITSGMPADLIPYNELGYYPYKARGEVIIESESGMPIAAVKEYGKGRVVALGYYPGDIIPDYSFPVRGSCFDSAVLGLESALHFDYLEYFYSLLAKSVIWAARKEPCCTIKDVNISDGHIRAEVEGCSCGKIYCRIKNLYDDTVYEEPADALEISLPDWLKLGGDFRAEVFLKDGDKVIDWWTVPISYPLTAEVTRLACSTEVIKPGEILKAEVAAKGSGAVLKIKVIDDFDRIIHLEEHNLDHETTVDFCWQVENVKSLRVRIEAEVCIDGHYIHKAESKRIIVIPQVRKINDFEVFMAPLYAGRPDFMQFLGKLFRGIGITCGYPGDSKVVTSCGASGLGVYWYHRAGYVERKEKYLATKDKKYLYRVPCLNDPDFWAQIGKKIIDTVSQKKMFNPIAYFANDEGSVTCYTDELDLCFCPHCMKSMREWLKEEYKDLDELNNVWGTSFKSWDEVVPYTYEEARKTGQYASWGDHRLFMEMTFANAYRIIRDYIRQEDSDGVVRMSGCQASTPYSGCDYYQLHEYVGYFEAYEVGNQLEYHRSFARPGTILGGWTGYGVSGVNADHQIWSRMYHGLTLMSIFWQPACLNPDFTYSNSAMDMARNFIEIRREGIGKLLLHTAKRDNLGIAIHYSMPSVHGSYAIRDEERFKDNRQGWINILEDMGYQYDFVATQQIEAGELISKNYKLLILPYSIAISAKEAEEIRRFVENGGTIIGDFQTGIMDKHCKLYDQGFLDDVLGIKRYTNEARPFYTNREFMKNKDFDCFDAPDVRGSGELYFAEPGTRPSSGKAAYIQDFSRKVSAVIVNSYGKGKGIYLNFSLAGYPRQRKEENGGYATRMIIGKILDFAGIEKFGEIMKPDGKAVDKGYETVYYSDGSAKYMAVIRDFESKLKAGHDGLVVGGGEDIELKADEIVIRLPVKYHVYDIRNKEYLGYTDTIKTAIANGDNGLFSLLPYRVEAIEVNVPEKVAPGDELEVSFRILTDKPRGEYTNVVAINVYDPEGEYVWLYSENVALCSNEAARKYHIPFNEKTGIWKVVIKDVATGVKAEKEFEITA